LIKNGKNMPRSALTGSRIRERRTLEGLKQADLARKVGISPAYLNLIEHNRRRIGGKLLVDLARELKVEVAALTEGAQAPLINGLQDAAAESGAVQTPIETDRIEEFAGRFSGWAGLVVQQREQITTLERRVEALSDRLAHDPFLSDALHEVISTVTAIRSTAGILNNGGDIDPEWQVRFHRNMYEDSQRLATGSQTLVSYLDTVGKADEAPNAPLDEVESWLASTAYELPQADVSKASTADVPQSEFLTSPAARSLAAKWLARAYDDAIAMPIEDVETVMAEFGPDPAALAQKTGADLAAAMRRLATLPKQDGRADLGLVTCDGSGTLTFRKPLDGFAPPRFGAACPLWPLYQALLRPLAPVRRVIEQMGQPPRQFLAYAVCQPVVQSGFDTPEVVEATMLFVPMDVAMATGTNGARGGVFQVAGDVVEVGTNCRVCARTDCPARREPSLLVIENDR
jgi:predicted transcriptional regulator/transcriptional regulator with XRE-family HTH domain